MHTETTAAPAWTVVRRVEYTPPAWLVDHVQLTCELDDSSTLVTARLSVRRNPAVVVDAPLVLDGQELTMLSISLDDVPLPADRYLLTGETLTIPNAPAACTLEIATRLDPQANSSLEGLYWSAGLLC
ncbi:MAG TPA: aminopeptidase N, partial [Geobacteraceae bacterium]